MVKRGIIANCCIPSTLRQTLKVHISKAKEGKKEIHKDNNVKT